MARAQMLIVKKSSHCMHRSHWSQCAKHHLRVRHSGSSCNGACTVMRAHADTTPMYTTTTQRTCLPGGKICPIRQLFHGEGQISVFFNTQTPTDGCPGQGLSQLQKHAPARPHTHARTHARTHTHTHTLTLSHTHLSLHAQAPTWAAVHMSFAWGRLTLICDHPEHETKDTSPHKRGAHHKIYSHPYPAVSISSITGSTQISYLLQPTLHPLPQQGQSCLRVCLRHHVTATLHGGKSQPCLELHCIPRHLHSATVHSTAARCDVCRLLL
jgi:hypothetical protein